MKNTKLDEYLNEISVRDFINPAIILQLVGLIIMLILTLIAYISISKRNTHLEEIIRKITGKKYHIRIQGGIKEPGAFCFGGFGKTIFLTEGLLEILNEREVISVCLHEISHITSLDSIKSIGVSLVSLGFFGILLKASLEILTNLSASFRTKAVCGSICLIILAYLVKETPNILLGKIQELRSDKNAIKYGYGRDLISTLEKLERWNKNHSKKKSKLGVVVDKINRILSVHPSTKRRIERLFNEIELYEKVYGKDYPGIKKIVSKVLQTS